MENVKQNPSVGLNDPVFPKAEANFGNIGFIVCPNVSKHIVLGDRPRYVVLIHDWSISIYQLLTYFIAAKIWDLSSLVNARPINEYGMIPSFQSVSLMAARFFLFPGYLPGNKAFFCSVVRSMSISKISSFGITGRLAA